MKKTSVVLLLCYVFTVGLVSTMLLIFLFPEQGQDGNIDFSKSLLYPTLKFETGQGMLMLAFVSGVAGSFIYMAQSLASYLGNKQFEDSWVAWYFLRPWIGGVLGVAIFATFRAGFVGQSNAVNVYGVVAFSLLGGWFSKITSDKLQEVFETLFKPDKDRARKDRLKSDDERNPNHDDEEEQEETDAGDLGATGGNEGQDPPKPNPQS